MQLLSRPAAAAKAAARSAAPSVRPAFVRPSVSRKFRERDNIEETKEKVKSGADGLKDALRNAAKPGDGFDAQYKVNPATPAFTRRREVFTGRLAIFGITAAFFWEYILADHPNILQQITKGLNLVGLNVGTNVSLYLVLGIIGYSAISFLPGNPTYSEENQEDVSKRPPGPNQKPLDPTKPKEALGISGFGFSKKNEVFVGRMAMLGFVAGILGQLWQGGLEGPGPLAQVAGYLGTTADNSFYASLPPWFLAFSALVGVIGYAQGNTGMDNRKEEKDIY